MPHKPYRFRQLAPIDSTSGFSYRIYLIPGTDSSLPQVFARPSGSFERPFLAAHMPIRRFMLPCTGFTRLFPDLSRPSQAPRAPMPESNTSKPGPTCAHATHITRKSQNPRCTITPMACSTPTPPTLAETNSRSGRPANRPPRLPGLFREGQNGLLQTPDVWAPAPGTLAWRAD